MNFADFTDFMSLQQWDNVVSIASNAVVIGGVFFGGSKLREFVKNKKQGYAVDAALALKHEIDITRGNYNQMRFRINQIMTFLTTLSERQERANAQGYYDVQLAMKDMAENTFRVGSAFVKTRFYSVEIKPQSWKAFNNLLDATGNTQLAISSLMSNVMTALAKPLIEQVDLDEIRKAYDLHGERMKEVNKAVSEMDGINFDDLFDFSKVNKKAGK